MPTNTPKSPKTTQGTYWTRATLFWRMSAKLDDLANANGTKKRLHPGDAAIQLRLLDELEESLKQLRFTLKHVAAREALASQEEKSSSSEASPTKTGKGAAR